MSTAYITIFGLNTPTDSACFGLRAFVLSLMQPGDAAVFLAYDDPQLTAKAAMATLNHHRIVLIGHSFGGAAAKYILDRWSVGGALVADAAIFLDPAPEAVHFGQFFSWQAADANLLDRWHIPLSVCRRALCFYQRNEQIIPGVIAVCGVPFMPVPIDADATIDGKGELSEPLNATAAVQNVNVSGWGLYHCHMLGDPRVQAQAKSFLGEE